MSRSSSRGERARPKSPFAPKAEEEYFDDDDFETPLADREIADLSEEEIKRLIDHNKYLRNRVRTLEQEPPAEIDPIDYNDQILELETLVQTLKNPPKKRHDTHRGHHSRFDRHNTRDFFYGQNEPSGFYTAMQSRRNSLTEDDLEADPLLQSCLTTNSLNRLTLLSALKDVNEDHRPEFFRALKKHMSNCDIEKLRQNYTNYHKKNALRTSILLGDTEVDTRFKDLPFITFDKLNDKDCRGKRRSKNDALTQLKKSLDKNFKRITLDTKSADLYSFFDDIKEAQDSHKLNPDEIQTLIEYKFDPFLRFQFKNMIKQNGSIEAAINDFISINIQLPSATDIKSKFSRYSVSFDNILEDFITLNNVARAGYPNETRDQIDKRVRDKIYHALSPEIQHKIDHEEYLRERLRDAGDRVEIFNGRVFAKKVQDWIYEMGIKKKAYPARINKKQEFTNLFYTEQTDDSDDFKPPVKNYYSQAEPARNYKSQPSFQNRTSPYGKRRGPNNHTFVHIDDPRLSETAREMKEQHPFKNNDEYALQLKNVVDTAAADYDQVQSFDFDVDAEPTKRVVNGRIVVDGPPYSGNVFMKKDSGSRFLAIPIMKYFRNKCYKCGLPNCNIKSSFCPLKETPSSWEPCLKCRKGFHLSKFCQTYIEE